MYLTFFVLEFPDSVVAKYAIFLYLCSPFATKNLEGKMMDCKKILTGLFEEIEYVKMRVPTAGTRFRLMALVADVEELTAQLQEVLQEVSKDAVIGVDDDVDFLELSEQTLEQELMPLTAELADVTQQVNDALGRLSGVLSDIASQLVRHHRDDEYERLYESEKRRYLSSGTPRRARKTFEEWKDLCYGMPTQEDIDNYRLEKVLHLFEKGVFDVDVTHIQRTKRYPGELEFDHLDDDHKLKKTIYKHYAAFRKMVDWKDGCLVVNAAHAGQHFYASRHEENAKAHRSAFMKYMHKIELVQQERRKLLEAETESDESSLLPDVLATGMAIKYWKELQKAGFVDERYQLLPTTSRKQAMYIADVFSDKLQMRSKWKPFQELWHINNLAQEKWEMQETGKQPARSEDIDKIFDD